METEILKLKQYIYIFFLKRKEKENPYMCVDAA